MLHQPASTFVPAATTTPAIAAASSAELKRARAWIAGARKCGMVVAPWKGSTDPSDKGGVLMHGQDEDGRNHFAAASSRFSKHPAFGYRDDLPEGLVYELLCEDYGVEHADPAFCDKVNARVRAEEAERKTADAERALLRLCRGATHILEEDERLETEFSRISDAFMEVTKPQKPDMGPFPDSYRSMSYAEVRDELQALRKMAKDKVPNWMLGLLVTGRFAAMVKDKKDYEIALKALKEQHGLLAAESAARKAAKQSRETVAAIAAIPATSPVGLAAKCRVMKVCLKTGWELHDVFEELASSIFDDGARCGDMLLPSHRPPRFEPAQQMQH